MSSIGTGYDLTTSQFSPEGRIFQVEYAQKAVENSSTAIGLRGKDGVVFAVEKFVASKLYEEGANKRIFTVDKHIGYAIAGLYADARQIVEHAKREAYNFRADYNRSIPFSVLKDRTSMIMHTYSVFSSVRPFGASVIIAAYDYLDGPKMFNIDPSGTTYGYFGCAIGKGSQAAKTEMERLKIKDMTCADLVKEAAKIIYIIHDEVKDKDFELELSWVGKFSNGKHRFVPDKVFQEAEKYAKAAIEEESDSDD